MRRTEKKEEVKKCSFEHASRATSWGVAGMTKMTRVAGLSCGAAKGQRPEPSPVPEIAQERKAQDPSYPPVWDICAKTRGASQ